MTEWTVNNKLNDWYEKQYHIKLPKQYETKARLYFSTAPAGFSPSTLFALAEPGVWYDPSDVANLAWRRNLFRYSQDFTNAVWQKSGTATVTTGQTDPLGGTTAAKIEFASIFQTHGQIYTFSGGETVTHSVWLRGDTAGTIRLADASGGVWGKQVSISTTWQRFDVTVVNVAAGPRVVAVQTGSGDLTTVYVAFQQLELGSVASDYQRISDVNTEVIERFPSATLYQDTAGTTPVTTPGQTVALALDKSKGLVLGPELVANGTFDSGISGWVKGVGTTNPISWDSVGQRLVVTNDLAYLASASQTISGFVVGMSYLITGVVSANTVQCKLNITFGPESNLVGVSGGNARLVFTATSTTHTLSATNQQNTLNGVAYWDNISVRELPGFHATQATAASRPTYGIVPRTGRRNLLTYSEDLTNAAWVVDASGVTKTATRIAETATTTAHYIRQAVPNTLSGNFAFSCEVKADGRRYAWLYAATSSAALIYYDLQLGTVASVVGSGVSGSISAVGDGYYRISMFANMASPIGNVGVGLTDINGTISYAGDVTKGLFIRNCQLETGSTATAYQRVGSAFDVTEAGVASLSYLSFDGVDDFLVTPTITPGTDKAQVFAGVRANNTAGPRGFIANMNAGGFNALSLIVPTAVANQISFGGFGDNPGGSFNLTESGLPANLSAVLSGLAEISTVNNSFRRNGTQVASGGVSGAGNFGPATLGIGQRTDNQGRFNGNLFSLIVRFGANLDANTITNTETWVNGKTGAYA